MEVKPKVFVELGTEADEAAPVVTESKALPGHRGFVFVKDFRLHPDADSAIREAKSLNAIQTALENLEDQLEILHKWSME
ncbi:hypothetical protein CsatA_000818 [Cannabis sativa]